MAFRKRGRSRRGGARRSFRRSVFRAVKRARASRGLRIGNRW